MIFFLTACKSDLKSYFPHIAHKTTAQIFGVLYGLFYDIFFEFLHFSTTKVHPLIYLTNLQSRYYAWIKNFLMIFQKKPCRKSVRNTHFQLTLRSIPALPVTVAFRASDSSYRALYPSRRGSLHNTPLIRSWLCTWAIVLYSDSFIKSLNISVWFFI